MEPESFTSLLFDLGVIAVLILIASFSLLPR
jgi:hypothetical protein